MEKMDGVDFFDNLLHFIAIAIGLAGAGYLLLARNYFEGDLSEFVKWASLGIASLSLIHVFQDLAIFFPASHLQTVVGEHFFAILGFALVGVGAWHLHCLAEKTCR